MGRHAAAARAALADLPAGRARAALDQIASSAAQA
jgi:hypothetical protein